MCGSRCSRAWGIFEVFADTIVVCTLTALVVLTSGFVDLDTGHMLSDVQGSALVGQAFSTVFGHYGPKFIAVSILLFAYSTVLGWSHYGTKACEYLFWYEGQRRLQGRVRGHGDGGCHHEAGSCVGPFRHLQRHDDAAEPDRCAGPVRHGGKDHKNYIDRRLHGKNVAPLWSAFEEYQREEEAQEAAEVQLDKAANE